jgi:hypothetical protein
MKTQIDVHEVYQPCTRGVLVAIELIHEVYQLIRTSTRGVLVRPLFDPQLIHEVYTLKVLPRGCALFLLLFCLAQKLRLEVSALFGLRAKA